jgi:hypothetical protein
VLYAVSVFMHVLPAGSTRPEGVQIFTLALCLVLPRADTSQVLCVPPLHLGGRLAVSVAAAMGNHCPVSIWKCFPGFGAARHAKHMQHDLHGPTFRATCRCLPRALHVRQRKGALPW